MRRTVLTTTRVSDLRRGAAALAPLLLGIAPFGIVTGMAVADAGYGLAEALGLSGLVSAGAVQLAAIDLVSGDTNALATILTLAAINVRMLMYSATLAPHFRDTPLLQRAGAAALITDHVFAVTVAELQDPQRDRTATSQVAFLVGAGLAMWSSWQLANLTGFLVAPTLPEGLPIGFAIPLTFLALLAPSVTDRPKFAAALVGGLSALAASALPANLGMPLGVIVGVSCGVLFATRASGGQP